MKKIYSLKTLSKDRAFPFPKLGAAKVHQKTFLANIFETKIINKKEIISSLILNPFYQADP